MDLVLSTGGILALSPLIALIGLAIKLESRGPVFFRQTRVGERGELFTIFKFRSMYPDAEARRGEIAEFFGSASEDSAPRSSESGEWTMPPPVG